MLTISINRHWQLYWGVMPLPEGAEALGIVKRETGTGALIRLANGVYVQGNAGGICNLPQSEVAISLAAASLGHLGGSSTSPAKQQASRENGKLGGRPRKPTIKAP